MRNKSDMIYGSVMIPLGIAVIIGSLRLKLGTPLYPLSGFFPFLGGLLLIALSIILITRGWLGRGQAHQPFGELRQVAILVVCLVIYVAVLETLGYVFSTILITAAILRIMGVTSWKTLSLNSLILSVGAYLLFNRILGVELPAGILSFLD
jgi:putative tricarboxylic transport membrane protein